MDDRIVRLANAPIDTHYKRKYCRLTHATEFKNAFSAILSDVKLAERVSSLHVDRKRLEATLHWAKPGHTWRTFGLKNSDLSKFAFREPYLQLPLAVEATLDGAALIGIATDLSESVA